MAKNAKQETIAKKPAKAAPAKVEPPKAATQVKLMSEAERKAWVAAKREGVGKTAYELIVAGKLNNAEILEEIKKRFKGKKDAEGKPYVVNTTMACIAWYRSHARQAGVIA